MKFKKEIYTSTKLNNRKMKISNDLSLKFEESISEEVIGDIISQLKTGKELEITSNNVIETDTGSFYDIKIFNTLSKGSFRIILSNSSIHLFQVFNASYAGTLPILDIVDFYQPLNQIEILV